MLRAVQDVGASVLVCVVAVRVGGLGGLMFAAAGLGVLWATRGRDA